MTTPPPTPVVPNAPSGKYEKEFKDKYAALLATETMLVQERDEILELLKVAEEGLKGVRRTKALYNFFSKLTDECPCDDCRLVKENKAETKEEVKEQVKEHTETPDKVELVKCITQ